MPVKNSIFVQMASYRDPELLPTIRDCIKKAKNPENLTFGICWQRGENDSLEEFINDSRFKIIEVPWHESKGACWARHLIQKLWNGEEYTIQLDSHHRFLQNWDSELIDMMGKTGSPKPIITSYVASYKPETNEILSTEPCKMVADQFNNDGLVLFHPEIIPQWQNLSSPIPARFISGHFYFTLGKHCIECKYDPNLYFHGEEISLSARSYTLGYDLFHPHKTVIWHEYTRKGRTKHWDDFSEENREIGKIKNKWWEMDAPSKERVRCLLNQEDNQIDLGEYGFGQIRTLNDYEFYAGINFKNKKVHPDTLAGKNPPINDTSEWFKLEEKTYNFNLNIPETHDFKFIYIGIEDIHGKQIYRKDLKEYTPTIQAEFKSSSEPYKWIYWPVDFNNNWHNRKDFVI